MMRVSLLLCLCLHLGACAEPSLMTRKELSDFRWMDGLGLPDPKGRPYGFVTLLGQSDDEGGEGDYRPAVLLRDGSDDMEALSLDLDRKTFRKTFEYRYPRTRLRYGFRTIDLAVDGDEVMGSLDSFDFWKPHLGPTGRRFVLAWICYRSSLLAQAHSLYQEVDRLLDAERNSGVVPRRTGTLRESMEGEIAHILTWRATLRFGDLSVSRKELLQEQEWLLERFPGSEHREQVREDIRILRGMVGEDEEHARISRPAPGMTQTELIADLVFQLRDQSGFQIDEPGNCDIFLDPRGPESPASRLVSLGYAAVPALIEALDDERFTRAVGCHRSFYFSHFVLRVGDCARHIL